MNAKLMLIVCAAVLALTGCTVTIEPLDMAVVPGATSTPAQPCGRHDTPPCPDWLHAERLDEVAGRLPETYTVRVPYTVRVCKEYIATRKFICSFGRFVVTHRRCHGNSCAVSLRLSHTCRTGEEITANYLNCRVTTETRYRTETDAVHNAARMLNEAATADLPCGWWKDCPGVQAQDCTPDYADEYEDAAAYGDDAYDDEWMGPDAVLHDDCPEVSPNAWDCNAE